MVWAHNLIYLIKHFFFNRIFFGHKSFTILRTVLILFIYCRDFVMFNYSIVNVLNLAQGTDDDDIIRAREKVSELIKGGLGIRQYTYKDICVHNGPRKYEWKNVKNAYLAGYTDLGPKRFHTLESAKEVSINKTRTSGITFDKKSKTYTIRMGNKIGYSSPNQESWIKIPL